MSAVQLHQLDLNLLLVLDVLLAEVSVQKAARRLGRTPSAVSHSLRHLRELLGDPLLVREGLQLVLTPRAQRLAEPLARVLGEVEVLLAHDRPVEAARMARTFTLGASDYAQLVALPPLLARLAEVAPDVTVAVAVAGDDVEALVRERRLDLAIGARFREAPGLMLQRYFDDPLVVVTRCTETPMTEARYLAARHVLVTPRGLPGGLVDDELARRGLHRRVVLRTPTFATAGLIVADSDLIVTMPEGAAERLEAQLALSIHPLPFALPPVRFGAIFSEVYRLDPEHVWLRQQLLELMKAR
jgi:DNA-binding transcriptional LysR family regulator